MVKTLLFSINEWGNIVVPFDLLEGISSKKGVGLQHWGEAKRCCFARFENRQEIECYIPITFFCE